MTRRIAMTRPVAWCAAALACASAMAACTAKDEGDETVHAVVAAQTMIVRPQAFTETLGAIGTVVARAGHAATLSAPAPARISQVLVTSGQIVQAGQRLVVLDEAPFQAALQSAQAAYTAAEQADARQQRLAQEGIAPRKDAEAAAAELARARSDVVAAQRTADLAVLRAPIDGVVTRMNATIGAMADPAQPLVEIADPKSLDVLLNVTPGDAARVQPGAKVTLSAGQSATGEPLGVGTVVDVAATVDSTTRSVPVRVEVPTTRRPLRIGETVYGAIATGTRPSAIVVPPEALVPNGDSLEVFVVDANGTAHERPVTVGGRTPTGVEIVAGLTAGERVVTSGAYGVQDSAKVTAPPADTAKPEQP
jgi:RND family efflux transporter MFP subunit